MRKAFSVALCLAVLLSVCAAPVALSGGEKEVVNFWYLWAGQEEVALKEVIEQYNAQSDRYAVTGSLCDITKQIAGMSSRNGPDITDIVDNSVSNLAGKGIIRPLDEYLQQEPAMAADFIPAAMRQCTWQGAVYGLPVNAMITMNYYNKKAFADAGIEKLPETFEEYKQVIYDLTLIDEQGNLIQSGWPWTNGLGYQDLVLLMGGSFYNEDMTEVTPDCPEMIEALTFAQEYAEKFGVENIRRFNASLGAWISAQDPFFVGKQAICASGWWLSHYVELTGHSEDLDWGVFPMPTSDALKGAGRVSTSIFVVPANGKNPDGAWDFLKFLMAPDHMATLMTRFYNEPARVSAGSQPDFQGLPAFEDFFTLALNARTVTFPGHSIEAEYSQALNAAVNEVMALKISPEDAMAGVKAQIQPVLDKANRK